MKKILALASVSLALSAASEAMAQYNIDYNFYFRSGISYSRSNIDGVCFNQPGWPDIVARLGNECGNYAEMIFKKDYKPDESNPEAPWYRGQITFSSRFNGLETQETVKDSNDFEFANRELFAEAYNLLGKDSKLWIGRRFYRRIQFDMWDFFALENNGSGGGVMDVPLGSGSLSLAWLRRTRDEPGAPLHNNLDLRYLMPMGDHNLETIIIAGEQGTQDAKTGDRLYEKVSGQSLGFFLYSNKDPYRYKILAQYGQGLYGARPDHYLGGWDSGSTLNQFDAQAFKSDDAAQVEAAKAWRKSWTGRITANLTYSPGGDWFVDQSIFFGRSDFGGRKDSQERDLDARDTFAVGIRPAYFFDEQQSAEFDLYYSEIKNGVPYQDKNFQTKYDGKPLDRTLQKVTIAYVIRPMAFFWSKPNFRFYGTLANWGKDQKGDNYVTGYDRALFSDKTSGYNFGMQVEAWF